MREEIIKMFDETVIANNLSGIMGNATQNDYELTKIKEVLNRIEFRSKENILDAGIGIGRLVPLYKEIGFKNVTGIDFSPKMVEKCRIEHPEIEVRQGDLCDLSNMSDDLFDVSMMMYTLIHIVEDNDALLAIRNIERITKGEVVIGQVMDYERQGTYVGNCKIREVYKIIQMFKTKRLKHFFKNFYQITADDKSWTNNISFLVMQ